MLTLLSNLISGQLNSEAIARHRKSASWFSAITPLFLTLLAVSACTPKTKPSENTITPVADKLSQVQVGCPYPDLSNAIELFGERTHITKGWNHITTPSKAQDFVGLKQPFQRYDISPTNHQSDSHCAGAETFQATLVKKLHVWNNNHSNGIETDIPPIPIEKWQAIELILRVNSQDSVIPDTQLIAALFPEINPLPATQFDQGNANIDVVFRSGEIEAAHFIQLDPAKDFDQWLRVIVPAKDLRYTRQVNYTHHLLDVADIKGQIYQTMSLKAETSSKKTIQHLNKSKEPEKKLFKEIQLSIYRISLLTL